MSLASRILEDTFNSPWPWPLASAVKFLALGLDTHVLDSINASDDDDVSALWQPLYKSVIFFTEVYVILQNVCTVFWV